MIDWRATRSHTAWSAGAAGRKPRPRPAPLRPRRNVVLVGPRGWADDVAAVAPTWRRKVLTRVDPTMFDGALLDGSGVDELVVSHLAFDVVTAQLPYSSRAGIALLVADDAAPQHVFSPALTPGARAFKRLLDVVVGSIALVVTSPLLAAAMIAIRIETRGPVLFKQMRPGLNGRAFRLLKLRTMHINNDEGEHTAYVAALINGSGERQGGMYKLAADPRVTRVGRVLRRYSIDELPQLVNVVRGDMSLVGPRPPVTAELDFYDAAYWLRLRVKPGLTGAWQVAGRCELTYAEMVALDIGYWQQWSFRSELVIILRTLPAVLSTKGAA
jgi:lipopolysaccharide/colanic/teichoic acid biosynthesis glycosyltransferase